MFLDVFRCDDEIEETNCLQCETIFLFINKMEYNSYSKIELTTNDWSPKYKKVKKWAVTEKVHGANFAFIYENGTISYGKRSGAISPSETFFNYKSMLNDNLLKIQIVIERVLSYFPECKQITIYGELFGGAYPDIEYRTMPVQLGVYYSPDIHFYGFDIFVVDNTDRGRYLDFEQSLEFFQSSGILYAEPLAIFPSFEKAAHFKLGFNSTIPAKFHLPALPVNKAEGIVIRSMTDRFIVKRKIVEFAEEVYSDNTIRVEDKKAIALCFMTENRLNNTISKVGMLEEYRYQIYELFCQDIVNELNINDLQERKTLKTFIMDKTILKFGE